MSKVAVRHIEKKHKKLPATADGLRLLHLSDLHLRRWGRVEQETQRLLTSIDHDLLVITGDFCFRPQQHARAAELTNRLLEPVSPKHGIIAVLGNHDLPCFTAHETRLRFLRNSNMYVELDSGGALCLAGVEQSHHRRGEAMTALEGTTSELPRILLTHYPSTAFELPSTSGVLVLAGHTHGGQIRIPGIGCVYNNDRIPVSMSRGLHLVNGNWLHVSAGIGASPPVPTRLFCPPEIGLITLRTRVRRDASWHREYSAGKVPVGV